MAEWEAVRHQTDVKIVEEGTEKIIDQMQKNHVMVMGLTTQGLALATRTVVQLKSLLIDLYRTQLENWFLTSSALHQNFRFYFAPCQRQW